jgi:hypothetical protein
MAGRGTVIKLGQTSPRWAASEHWRPNGTHHIALTGRLRVGPLDRVSLEALLLNHTRNRQSSCPLRKLCAGFFQFAQILREFYFK